MICPKKIFYRSLKKKLKKKDTVLVFASIISIAITLSYIAGKFAILLLPLDLISYFELQEESSPPFYLLMLVVSALGEFAWSLLLTIENFEKPN